MKTFAFVKANMLILILLLVVLGCKPIEKEGMMSQDTPIPTEPTRTPGPTSTPRPTQPPPTATPTNPIVDWELVWSDEFDIDGLPDSEKWNYEEGFIRNNESQYYTRRLDNARLEDGNLVIEARKESYQEAEITSASLVTRGKAEWTNRLVNKYGHV